MDKRNATIQLKEKGKTEVTVMLEIPSPRRKIMQSLLEHEQGKIRAMHGGTWEVEAGESLRI